MKFQKTYSAEEFADQVGEKVANIRAFRLFAREFNLIQNHELLTEAFYQHGILLKNYTMKIT